MVFETNKEKGNSGLVTAIAYYGLKGYTVSIPLNDTQDYDLIVDNGESLLKVQVKATSQRTPYGYTTFAVKSCGGTNGSTYKTIKDTNVDIIFVVTELQEMYEIPIDEITTTSSMNLGPDRQCFRVDDVNTEYVLKTRESNKTVKYCSNCHKELGKSNQTGLCVQCLAETRRTVERPSKEQLLQELKESNFTQVGKRYNVTDNTIRKWCKAYELPTHIKEIKDYCL